MHLGYELKVEQRQTLSMTPELIQAIKILQYNIQELNEYVDEQLLSNPFLEMDSGTKDEEGRVEAEDAVPVSPREKDGMSRAGDDHTEEKRREDFDWQEYLQAQEYDDVSYSQPGSYMSDRPDDISIYAQSRLAGVTLIEHLTTQLLFSGVDGESYEIGQYIIESLDDNGYMTLTQQEIAENCGVSQDEVEKVISVIRTFDPAGVCASCLSECLLMQLDILGVSDKTVIRIISEHIEDLASNRLALIAKKCGLKKEEAQRIADTIRCLEPKPGRSFYSGTDAHFIIPDVIVEHTTGGYSVIVNNDETPRLIINPYYRRILRSEDKASGTAQFLSRRLNSAMWLIKSIDQRKDTIRRVAEAVVAHQSEFLERGSKHLRPLTLKMIADEIGMHESTVSRAVNGKYMQTPRGVFEIKYFFASGTTSGGADQVASGGIKAYIDELIKSEDPISPISDQSIADKLHMRGIDVSRRTVAKYRDEMGVPSSSARRRY
ncbi:MAG: RNA polymerase factor sigma-54 [Clostridiales Family XIII bacterium]|nr:RNA polymerase factor sigma-54 [Clostridiales Family XIII bacterium]